MAVISKDLGAVTAYAAAVNRGYTGTREEFEILMASYATVAQQAAESAGNASQSATDASQSAQNAETAKGTAQQAATDAQTAQASAQGYVQSAQQSAQSASQSAQSAESAKQTVVNAVDGFASGAQQALDSVNQAGINWKSLAQAKALDSEAYALGTRDGEDVGTSDPAYHNNAKYYAESVSASVTTASEAAQTATQKAGEAQASASAAAESARTLTIDATLTQAGQAADAKETGNEITSLKEDLDAELYLSEKTNIPIIITGKYVNSNGGYNTALDSSVTDYFEVEPNTKVKLSGVYLEDYRCCVAVDDDKQNPIVIKTDTTDTTISFIMPDGYYYLLATASNEADYIECEIFNSRISELEKETSEFEYKLTKSNVSVIEDILRQFAFVITNGNTFVENISKAIGTKSIQYNTPISYALVNDEYVLQDGSIQSYNGWSRTNFIPCRNVSKIEFVGNGKTFTTARYGAFYDKDMNFISNIPLTLDNNNTTVSIDVPSNADCFSISGSTSQFANIVSITPKEVN